MNVTKSQSKDRVLLVDDNPNNLQVLFQALKEEGYELLVAQSGEEAIATAKQARPLLILLDINMPGIDGYETCRRLKRDRETMDCAIVFLSARRDVDDKIQGLELGAVDYIEKPFQFEEVLARVRQHLATVHKHQKLSRENKSLKELIEGGFREVTDEEMSTLIAEGESERVEFKSTLRWNLHTNKPDKRIENACLKTVAAYLNSNGGFLLIGVDDEGSVLGLALDQFPNEDKLLLHWNGLLKSCLGVQVSPHIRSTIRPLGGKRVMVVQCLVSTSPVFLRRDNDETFFIRTGNATQPLKPSEVLAFLHQRDVQAKPTGEVTTAATDRLGQYTLAEVIGRGGMGIVYKARHAMLRRPAAIKLLDVALAKEHTLERFQREVQLSSQLTHPNTITIYDYGRTSDGSFYYVMELLDGLTLQELVEQHGPLPEGRVIHILEQVCGSLAEAHDAGLVHRDIKPANIMVGYRGGLGDFIKVLDFGMVKPIGREDEPTITSENAMVGSPMYISPEGVERPDHISYRSDLYSLGATAYFLLTGSTLFQGRSAFAICLKHMSTAPDKPSENRQLPLHEDLEQLVMQCLAKAPDDRPVSARSLLSSLSTCEAAETWTQEMATTWWSAHGSPVGASVPEIVAKPREE